MTLHLPEDTGTGLAARLDEVVERIGQCGVIPVVQLPRPEAGPPLAEALLEAGLPIIELTFRAAGAPEAIASVRQAFPDILIGAGTVLNRDDALRAVEAGAHFIVSPGSNPRVIEVVHGFGNMMLPGVGTPSEVEANLERGISVMKFFPAPAYGGPTWLKAVRGPFPSVRFVPTGGVTPASLRDYLGLPNVLACGGTWLAPVATLERGGYDEIRRVTREAVALVRAIREERP